MTIRIELTSDEEMVLREQAARQGRPVEELAGDAIRLLVHEYFASPTPHLPRVVDEAGAFHPEHWDTVMASITRGSAHAPVLPAEALTRAALYGDHD